MKLKGSKKIMGGLALAAALALTGVVGFAQQQQQSTTQGQDGTGHEWRHKRGGKEGRGMRAGGFGARFAERLNLTDAQKEQLKQIAARYRESTKALRQQARAARHGGDAGLINGGAFDEAAVRAAAQARAGARVELEVARARMMSEMYAVLTPEQKSQLATERQQWEQKRQERRARRGASDQNQ
ncbi:MAG TPA: Spy/CpxP family protein refolding chaperone [Pyrinomonadaceae bacterium]|jgi:Spy/CpxP family protein refolding chaperone|nr:Spy/CpxP family protein refolding chaperone [Pyrinomonadaceae bacterium]